MPAKMTLNVSHLSDFKARPLNSLKTRLPEFTRQHLSQSIKTMLDEADDTLFDFSSKADTNLAQQAYLDAMREIRINRTTIEHGFLTAVQHAFEVFQINKNLSDILKKEKHPDEETLELIDEESMEEDIAVYNMADKQERRYQRDIFEIKSRIKAVYQCHDKQVDTHPLSPITIVNAFTNTLESLDIEFHVKLIILKLFDKFVMNDLGNIYKEVNNLLISEKILPNLAYQYKRNRQQAISKNPGHRHNHVSEYPPSDQQFEWETVEQTGMGNSNAHSNRLQADNDSLLPTDFGLQGFMPVPSQASGIIGTLSDMQDYLGQVSGPLNCQPKQMGLRIIDGIHRMGFDSVNKNRALDDNIINMVSLIFDFIVEEKAINEQIKSLLARMQIPFLKLALLDDTFLKNNKHPARLLLNAMADASIGWDAQRDRNTLYDTLETIVEKILGNFDQDISLFADLLTEFNTYCEHESNINRTYEERTWKTTEGKERVELAKKRVDAWIHMWCSRTDIRQQIVVFLKHFWKNTLLNCLHQHGEDSKEWKYYTKLINTLIWSTTSGKNSDEVKQLINVTPLLIRGLNRGLQAVGTHPKTISDIFKEFSKCHLEIIEKGLKKTVDSSSGYNENETAIPTLETLYDPAMLDSKNETDSLIDESLELLVSEESNTPTPEIETGDSVNSVAEDEFDQLASNINYGDWIEFDLDSTPVPAKLAWKSSISKNHLFVGRNGMRVAEKNLTDIADALRKGSARIINHAPLTDRALDAIRQSQG